jgi:hypothetical protein
VADLPTISDHSPDASGPPKRRGAVARVIFPRRRRLLLVGVGGAIFLLLVVVGIAALLNLRGDRHAAVGVAQTFAAPRAGNSAKIALTANAATVGVHPLDTANPNLLQGSFTPGKDRGDALLQHKGDTWALQEENGSADSADSAAWDVGIAPGTALDLSMSLDATS